MENRRKRMLASLLVLAMVVTMAGCTVKSPKEEGTKGEESTQVATRILVDATGREVEVKEKVETILCLGSGAPRLGAYLGIMDRVIGSEAYLKDGVNLRRDYNPLYHEALLKLPVVGEGGGSGQNNAFPEEIILLNPDVIIAGFDQEAADELQRQTGIPVVSVRHETGLAPASFYRALRVFGEVVHKEARAEELLLYVEEMLEDLDMRTKDVPLEEKRSVYAGAVTWNGRRGFSGTYSNFGIFEAIHANNVAQLEGIDGFYEADLEQILTWDPEVIFLDPGNMDLVLEEYRGSEGYFNSLQAVKEGNLYTIPAFNNAGTNFTYAFINAYFAGIVLLPEAFSDVDLEKKAEEILTTFLGANTFSQMAEAGLYYGKITLEE